LKRDFCHAPAALWGTLGTPGTSSLPPPAVVGRVWLSAPELGERIKHRSFLENRVHSMPRSGRAEPDAPYHKTDVDPIKIFRRKLSDPLKTAKNLTKSDLFSVLNRR